MTDRGDMKRNTRRRARKLKSETRHNEWGTLGHKGNLIENKL